MPLPQGGFKKRGGDGLGPHGRSKHFFMGTKPSPPRDAGFLECIQNQLCISSNLLASFFLRRNVWDMRAFLKASLCLLACTALVTFLRPVPALAADVPAKTEKPKLYDTQANGNQQIGVAIKTATAENKRIILKFGANW